MSSMLIALLVPIVLATLVFTIVLGKAAIAERAWPTLETLGLGAVVNFFDTLGIGSFAPTTAWLKFRHLTPDRLIPPTILVGLTAGAVVELVIFLLKLGVKVDPVLLVGCILACTTGGTDRRAIGPQDAGVDRPVHRRGRADAGGDRVCDDQPQHVIPGGGTATSLPVALTILAIVANFMLRRAAQLRRRQLRADAW